MGSAGRGGVEDTLQARQSDGSCSMHLHTQGKHRARISDSGILCCCVSRAAHSTDGGSGPDASRRTCRRARIAHACAPSDDDVAVDGIWGPFSTSKPWRRTPGLSNAGGVDAPTTSNAPTTHRRHAQQRRGGIALESSCVGGGRRDHHLGRELAVVRGVAGGSVGVGI